MRYQLAPIFCRPWVLNGLSQRLIESHYENNYGGALKRLNAIVEAERLRLRAMRGQAERIIRTFSVAPGARS